LKTTTLKTIGARLFRALPSPVTCWVVGGLNTRFNISVVGIITSADGRVLVLRHVFRRRYAWGLPAGFLAAGETPEAAMIREAREETGLAVTVDRILAIYPVQPRHMEVVVIGRADGRQPIRPSAEIFEGAFFAPDALPEEIMPSHGALLRDALASRGPSLQTEV
jgi:8-oxo-dGTP diphosphatase